MKREDVLGNTSRANPPGSGLDPIDWEAKKLEILSRLDLFREYQKLDVDFVQETPTASGRNPCHARFREDGVASAVVFLPSGVYHDSGSGEKDLGFLDFALKAGGFKKFIDVFKHYAEVAGVEVGKIALHSGSRFREAVHLYRDEAGSVLFASFRYRLPTGKKTFSQRGADGKGGWRFDEKPMDGVRMVPFRLPELLASGDDETVFIVEGETTADRLAKLGFVATTNAGGSNKGSGDKTWRPSAIFLDGRDVVILPDNDAPGIAHARNVANILTPFARSLKVVQLPDVGPKGDACDYFDRGHTPDELLDLIDAAPAYESDQVIEPEKAPGDDLPHISEVISVCMDDVVAVPVRWLWPDRIPLGKITLIAGEQKAGKSFLTMDLIARVSAGLEIPGADGECFDQASVVLLSAEDDDADTIKPRLIACNGFMKNIHHLKMIKEKHGKPTAWNLNNVPHLEALVNHLPHCRLVIIDPVPHYVSKGVDDHKNTEIRALLEPLKELANRRGLAMVLISHLNKGTGTKAMFRVTGSGAYTALARSNWLVVKDASDPRRRLLVSAGTNLVEDPSGLAYRIDKATGRLEWEDAPVMMTADEALEANAGRDDDEGGKGSGKGPKVATLAEAWLRSRFVPGGPEILSSTIDADGKALGFNRSVLGKAKDALGIKARKGRSPEAPWVWYWPEDGDRPADPLEPNFTQTLPIR